MIQNIECFFTQTFLTYAYVSDLVDLFYHDIFAVLIPLKVLRCVFVTKF